MKKITLTVPEWFLAIAELAAAAYGIASSLFPNYIFFAPKEYGVMLALVNVSMLTVLVGVALDRTSREQAMNSLKNHADKQSELASTLASKLSLSIPFHERDFYTLWNTQVRMAQHSVDVTHLGTYPPKGRKGIEEKAYFETFNQLYVDTRATVRRVERLSPEKANWIRQVATAFKGQSHCSLAVYRDPSTSEFPFAISVCRVDDRFSWLIALAEHDSTKGFRDILLTGRESVELIRDYFDKRLWKSPNTIIVVDHGTVSPDLERILASCN